MEDTDAQPNYEAYNEKVVEVGSGYGGNRREYALPMSDGVKNILKDSACRGSVSEKAACVENFEERLNESVDAWNYLF